MKPALDLTMVVAPSPVQVAVRVARTISNDELTRVDRLEIGCDGELQQLSLRRPFARRQRLRIHPPEGASSAWLLLVSAHAGEERIALGATSVPLGAAHATVILR